VRATESYKVLTGGTRMTKIDADNEKNPIRHEKRDENVHTLLTKEK
jgi:hypothetical protein